MADPSHESADTGSVRAWELIGNPRQCNPGLHTTDLYVATKARGFLDFCQLLVLIEQTAHGDSLKTFLAHCCSSLDFVHSSGVSEGVGESGVGFGIPCRCPLQYATLLFNQDIRR